MGRNRDGREKGTIRESGNSEIDRKRCACINKILQFDGTINFKDDFDFVLPPGVGSRAKRLIDHLISLACLPTVDRIHAIIFPRSTETEAARGHHVASRSRSPWARSSASAHPSDLHLAGVVVHDRYGAPIGFPNDQQTTGNLLRVLEAQNVRTCNVKTEFDVKDEIAPDDSASCHGVIDARPGSSSLGASSKASGHSLQTDLASIISCSTSTSNGAIIHCFLAGILFRMANGELVEASCLKEGDSVRACEGQTVQVRSVSVHRPQELEVVELRAGHVLSSAAFLSVTPSHRVMVQRGTDPQTMPAGFLRVGDTVYCSGGRLAELVHVGRRQEECEVVDVVFRPDEPVEAFFPSILSKGHGWPRTTRRSRRSIPEDRLSLPDTLDSWL